MENVRPFALEYLDAWCEYDRGFVNGIRSEARIERLHSLNKAARYYGIARTLKIDPGERRLDKALRALEAIRDSAVEGDVDSAVKGLAENLHKAYGSYAISAASKFLWLRHLSPVVIYDSRAIQALRKMSTVRFDQCNYSEYRQEWLEEFTKREAAIMAACSELARVKDFSLADNVPDQQLKKMVGNKWFRERVFDKFLWWNGSKDSFTVSPAQFFPRF